MDDFIKKAKASHFHNNFFLPFMTDKKRKMTLSSIHNMDMILKRRKLTLLLPGIFTIIVLPLTPAAGLENKNRRIYVDL